MSETISICGDRHTEVNVAQRISDEGRRRLMKIYAGGAPPLTDATIGQLESIVQHYLREEIVERHPDSLFFHQDILGLRYEAPTGQKTIVATDWVVATGSKRKVRQWFKTKEEEAKKRHKQREIYSEYFQEGADQFKDSLQNLPPEVLFYLWDRLESYQGSDKVAEALLEFYPSSDVAQFLKKWRED